MNERKTISILSVILLVLMVAIIILIQMDTIDRKTAAYWKEKAYTKDSLYREHMKADDIWITNVKHLMDSLRGKR